jgi:hypothetical protein
MISLLVFFQDVEQLKLNNVVSLNEATQTMDTNPIKTAITVCSQLIQRQVRIYQKAGTFYTEQSL